MKVSTDDKFCNDQLPIIPESSALKLKAAKDIKKNVTSCTTLFSN